MVFLHRGSSLLSLIKRVTKLGPKLLGDNTIAPLTRLIALIISLLATTIPVRRPGKPSFESDIHNIMFEFQVRFASV